MYIMGTHFDTGALVFMLIISLLLAVIPARIASKKGYSYAGFYVFGFFLWIVALIVSLVIQDRKGDASQQLINYKRLLDEGAITQEEFEQKKNELLK